MSKQQILDCVKRVPFCGGDTLDNHISDIIIRDGVVGFTIYIESSAELEAVRCVQQEVATMLQELEWVKKVSIAISNKLNPEIDESIKHFSTQNVDEGTAKTKPTNIDKIIPVISGKGGVGKSTVSVMLAESLVAQGYKVGLLDADIYGPSIPLFFQMKQKPEIIANKFQPIIARGIEVMSIGLLVDGEQALSWRGPMITKSLNQLLMATDWGKEQKLDYLIIDTPPGTGDIHLSLLKTYQIYGALVVTTSHMLSFADTARTIDLYKKFDCKLLGVIENMSGMFDIEDENAAHRLATMCNTELLAHIPIEPKLAKSSGMGKSLLSLSSILQDITVQ